MAQTTARNSAWPWYGLGFGGPVVIMVVTMAAARIAHVPALLLAGTLLASLWALACAGLAWKRVDETARAAQQSAWFWGGSFGLALALLAPLTMLLARGFWHEVFVFLDAHHGAWPLPALSFISGIMFAALVQVAGALIAWAIWWATKR